MSKAQPVEQSLTSTDAKILHQALYLLSAVAMVAISAYMTKHYFEVHFPSGLAGASLCDISSFLNCSGATNSVLSNIAGVPIAFFGLLFGLFLLSGYLFSSKEIEGTNHFLSLVNFFGCLGLFLYSLLGLGSLCPFCSLYYVFSAIIFFLFFKQSTFKKPSFKVLGIYTLIAAVATGGVAYVVQGKVAEQKSIAGSLINQYDGLQDLGTPKTGSGFFITKNTDFNNAKIRLAVFSDFQCPGCKKLSDQMHEIAERFGDQVSIQYFFYPLDMNCNEKMTRAMHPLACQAAYLSSCLPEKFGVVHDDIFANQAGLSQTWLEEYAKKEGVLDCMKSPETKEKVVSILKQAEQFNIKVTPSMVVNGKKIEGALPISQLFIILDELAKR